MSTVYPEYPQNHTVRCQLNTFASICENVRDAREEYECNAAAGKFNSEYLEKRLAEFPYTFVDLMNEVNSYHEQREVYDSAKMIGSDDLSFEKVYDCGCPVVYPLRQVPDPKTHTRIIEVITTRPTEIPAYLYNHTKIIGQAVNTVPAHSPTTVFLLQTTAYSESEVAYLARYQADRLLSGNHSAKVVGE